MISFTGRRDMGLTSSALHLFDSRARYSLQQVNCRASARCGDNLRDGGDETDADSAVGQGQGCLSDGSGRGGSIRALSTGTCSEIPSALDELDVEGDADVFAYQHSTGFERRIPGQTEVLSIDFGRGGKADARVAPGVLAGGAGAFDGKGYGLGDAVHGQVACHGIFVLAGAFHGGGFEGHGRVLFDFKEVRALEVAVALGVAGVESGNVDGGLDCGRSGIGVVLVENAGQTGQAAFNVGDHHVLYLEFGGGVGRVEIPGDQGSGGYGGGCHGWWLLSFLWMRHSDIRCNK